MSKIFESDFGKVLEKISQINNAQRVIREGFAFSQNDKYSQKQKKIKEEWLKFKNDSEKKKKLLGG